MKQFNILINALWGFSVSILTYKDHIATWVAIITGIVMVLQAVNIIWKWCTNKKHKSQSENI